MNRAGAGNLFSSDGYVITELVGHRMVNVVLVQGSRSY
jgi:hypothetical protein